MEYVEGNARGAAKGPLPLDQALQIRRSQICDALDAAHRKGIVHRDLKPANIMLTKAGVKLLDFGLAKAAGPAAGMPDARRQAPDDAATKALTGAHVILGTPQYMAPEQIEGRDADARTDIFAFGCVLYEMLTGQKAFEGKTPSSTMAAILATEPRADARAATGHAAARSSASSRRASRRIPTSAGRPRAISERELEWIAASGRSTDRRGATARRGAMTPGQSRPLRAVSPLAVWHSWLDDAGAPPMPSPTLR